MDDAELMKLIAIITLDTSTSAEYCFKLSLEELIDFWNTLQEVVKVRRETNNGK